MLQIYTFLFKNVHKYSCVLQVIPITTGYLFIAIMNFWYDFKRVSQIKHYLCILITKNFCFLLKTSNFFLFSVWSCYEEF